MKARFLAFALVIAVSGSAFAADTVFGTSSLHYSPLVIVTTSCSIYNGGTKPVTIRSVGIPHWQAGHVSGPALTDDCTTEPLAPDTTCTFTTSLGVFGGGFARVKGSTKSLRGDCSLKRDDTSTAVITVPMR